MEKGDRQTGSAEQAEGSREPPRAARPAPGKVTRTSKLPSHGAAVQRKAAAAAPGDGGPPGRSLWDLTDDPWMDAAHRGNTALAERGQDAVQASGGPDTSAEDVHQLAAQGVSGAVAPLPHLEQIQSSFGSHDVSGIQAHIGGAAGQAADGMGAEAYATGNQVAFRDAPDLHTAAHEAAHVVQQRAGVSLSGGVGQEGDAYERHADAVADRVVSGESAEGLLDQMAGGGGQQAVQQRTSPGNALGEELARKHVRSVQRKPGGLGVPKGRGPRRPPKGPGPGGVSPFPMGGVSPFPMGGVSPFPMGGVSPLRGGSKSGGRAVQRRSANGVSVSAMKFSPKEIKDDGATTTQATVQYSARVGGTAKLNWTIEGDAFGANVNADGLITPGTDTVPFKDKDKATLTVKAVDSKEARAFTTGKLTMWSTKFLEAKEEYSKFAASTYKIANHVPPTGYGKFDVLYAPRARRLTATSRFKFVFLDDKPKAAKWNAASKRAYAQAMTQKVRNAWSGQWQFQNVRDPQSVWKKLNPVSVQVLAKEDNSAPHYTIKVHKKDIRPFIDAGTNSTGEFAANTQTTNINPFPATGPAELAALQAKIPTPIQFAAGSAAIPAADQSKLEFLGTYLHAVRNPKFNLTATGHAKKDPAAATPAQQQAAAKAARQLGAQRAAAVRGVIASRGIGVHGLRQTSKGSDGADATAAWDKVEIGSAVAPGYKNKHNAMPHEFGHMLGLDDEYTGRLATGAKTDHYALTQSALGTDMADAFARVTVDSEGLMQGGTDVRPHHYVTLWDALATATSTAAEPTPPFTQADWKFVGF